MIILYIYTVYKIYSSILRSTIKRVSISVLKIIHNAAITAEAPRKSPTANLKTVITLIELIELITDRIKFTNNPFNKDETIITRYRNL